MRGVIRQPGIFLARQGGSLIKLTPTPRTDWKEISHAYLLSAALQTAIEVPSVSHYQSQPF
jgi:hypothetical protein